MPSFKVTGSIQGSELPISVCSTEIGCRCILEGEHLKLAVAEWNWICKEKKKSVSRMIREQLERPASPLHMHVHAHYYGCTHAFVAHMYIYLGQIMGTDMQTTLFPIFYCLTSTDPLTHTHPELISASSIVYSMAIKHCVGRADDCVSR